ncbi:M3 family oligoendopeptidase [Saprospira grandis]|uniref:Oligoendopeptidase, M3 family protein n=1 Tax=Saprospira grandis (strain Lewin) TaxID=984262 RepID=H6L161_SAPGL|nr:M3 family oligoendopeptidase [Saprospira grandis]AFC26097.1 oligoendopeptidase, M3 family protein [Saprospira grandis str. Lewin]
MQFKDFPYQRPALEQIKSEYQALLKAFEAAPTAQDAIAIRQQISDLSLRFSGPYNLASVRHSIDTRDAFYQEEKSFFDQAAPEISALSNAFSKALLASPHKAEMAEQLGQHLFNLEEMALKTFQPEIIEDLKEQNRLSTRYQEIKAQAQIEFEGETYNLSTLSPLELSTDRGQRKGAQTAKWEYYDSISEEVEDIFDQLVKLRHKMAQKLGYENYIELGYARMARSDYGPQEVAKFRKQIEEQLVPLAQTLYKKQAERIGINKMEFYDFALEFLDGNPTPKGDVDWMVQQADQMYSELSAETKEFFRFMQDKGLLELASKDGKRNGGYCTYLREYQAPFIFSNFNGSAHDFTVLTHEAGHAFQCYLTGRSGADPDYIWPTYEACEIHSMSMEFFSWPWVEQFFKEDSEKFKLAHLSGAVTFLPYGAAVDEFQHLVYEHPEWTPAQRNAAWLELEERYLPHLKSSESGQPFLQRGGYWQRQTHIFASPFYYIDYVLAQICAFQFWDRQLQAPEKAWSDYIKLCKTGGRHSFLKLLEIANLQSPFLPDTVEKALRPVRAFLAQE